MAGQGWGAEAKVVRDLVAQAMVATVATGWAATVMGGWGWAAAESVGPG